MTILVDCVTNKCDFFSGIVWLFYFQVTFLNAKALFETLDYDMEYS